MSKKKRKTTVMYASIDLSFNATGICIANKQFNRVTTALVTSRKDDHLFDRCDSIVRDISETIKSAVTRKSTKLKAIFVEQLSYGAKGARLSQISYLHYLVRRHFYTDTWFKPIPVYTVPATTLKKFVTGTGRCKKNLMLKCAYKNWGFDSDDDNIVDAYCLCRYGIEKQLATKPPSNERVM